MVYNKYKNHQENVKNCIYFYLTHKITQKSCAEMFNISYPIFIYYYAKYKERFELEHGTIEEAKKKMEIYKSDAIKNNEHNNDDNNKHTDQGNNKDILECLQNTAI